MSLNQKGKIEKHFHRDCFACGSNNGAGLRLNFRKKGDGSLYGYFFADPKYQSYPGILHGGIIATLLDSAMTHCLLMEDLPALTGRLSIRYFHPIRTGTVIKLEARVTQEFHRVFVLEGNASVEGKKMAKAEAKYMLPT
jgi:acyl-coenzyme A thioesterase PaaI-like protein